MLTSQYILAFHNILKNSARTIILTISGILVLSFGSLSCKEDSQRKFQQILSWEKKYKINYANYLPDYSFEKYPPKVIMFSAMDVQHLRDTASYWKSNGIDGFILDYVSDWRHGIKYLDSQEKDLTIANEACKKVGIEDNFYLIYLSRKEFPNWNDPDEKWEPFFDVFRRAVEIARDSGCKGVALDTEPYDRRLWEPGAVENRNIPEQELAKLIRKRSCRIMEIISQTFPESTTLIFPEGSFYYHFKEMGTVPYAYEMWEHFYDGILDAKFPGQVVLCLETTYQVTQPHQIKSLMQRIRDFYDKSTNPDYVRNHVTFCPGAYPLGKTYTDKSAFYSYRDFERQIRTFEKLNPGYIWIYGHGAAWWQMKDKTPYTANNRWIWEPKYQMAPCDPQLKEYLDVLNPERRQILKQYYKTLNQINR